MEENNVNTSEVKSEKKKVSIVVTILLFIVGIVLGVGGYYLCSNYLLTSKDTKTETTEENKKNEDKADDLEITYDAKSLFIRNLIKKYDAQTIGDYQDILFQNEKTDIASLDSNYLKVLAINNLNSSANILDSFTKEDLELSYKELFTSDIPVVHEDTMLNKCFTYQYIAAVGKYNYQSTVSGCGGAMDYQVQYSPISAKKTNDKLAVDVVVAYVYSDAAYKDKASTEKIADAGFNPSNLFVIDNYADKLNKFTFNFTYNQDNYSYTLDNVELVR